MRVAISEMPLAWKVLWSGESRRNASPADAGGHQTDGHHVEVAAVVGHDDPRPSSREMLPAGDVEVDEREQLWAGQGPQQVERLQAGELRDARRNVQPEGRPAPDERDRAEQIDRQQQMQEPPPYQGQQGPQGPQDSGGWNGNWRDRVNRDRGDRGDNGAAPQRNVQPAPAPGPARAAVTSDQYGRLRMKVEPDDASVYLDGRFVGTGGDLAGNEAGLLLSPGHHRVSVVRPGHRAEERDLDAVLGKDVDLTVTLKPSGPTG